MMIEGKILATVIIIAIILLTQGKQPLDKLIMLTIFYGKKTPSHSHINERQRGWDLRSLVRSVKHAPKTCKIGYRQPNLPQTIHISQNRKLYYNLTN